MGDFCEKSHFSPLKVENTFSTKPSRSDSGYYCSGDIAYPEGGNFTKKTKRRFRDNFDVRDTWSEPRLGRGLELCLLQQQIFRPEVRAVKDLS